MPTLSVWGYVTASQQEIFKNLSDKEKKGIGKTKYSLLQSIILLSQFYLYECFMLFWELSIFVSFHFSVISYFLRKGSVIYDALLEVDNVTFKNASFEAASAVTNLDKGNYTVHGQSALLISFKVNNKTGEIIFLTLQANYYYSQKFINIYKSNSLIFKLGIS